MTGLAWTAAALRCAAYGTVPNRARALPRLGWSTYRAEGCDLTYLPVCLAPLTQAQPSVTLVVSQLSVFVGLACSPLALLYSILLYSTCTIHCTLDSPIIR